MAIHRPYLLDPFHALADPTRRSIVEALRNGERQVNDIVEQAGIHQSGVSRHLRILHEAGFRGLDEWLAQYRNLWEARLDRLGAALEKQQSSGEPPNEEQDA
jgi:predicted transcriptional regulator